MLFTPSSNKKLVQAGLVTEEVQTISDMVAKRYTSGQEMSVQPHSKHRPPRLNTDTVRSTKANKNLRELGYSHPMCCIKEYQNAWKVPATCSHLFETRNLFFEQPHVSASEGSKFLTQTTHLAALLFISPFPVLCAFASSKKFCRSSNGDMASRQEAPRQERYRVFCGSRCWGNDT